MKNRTNLALSESKSGLTTPFPRSVSAFALLSKKACLISASRVAVVSGVHVVLSPLCSIFIFIWATYALASHSKSGET